MACVARIIVALVIAFIVVLIVTAATVILVSVVITASVVAVRVIYESEDMHLCESQLTDRFVYVTAARCVMSRNDDDAVKVLCNDERVGYGQNGRQIKEDIVESFLEHSEYIEHSL